MIKLWTTLPNQIVYTFRIQTLIVIIFLQGMLNPLYSDNGAHTVPLLQVGATGHYHIDNMRYGIGLNFVRFGKDIHRVYDFRYRQQHNNTILRLNNEYTIMGGLRGYKSKPVWFSGRLRTYWQGQAGILIMQDIDDIAPVYKEPMLRPGISLVASVGADIRITNHWHINLAFPFEAGIAGGYPDSGVQAEPDGTDSYGFISFLPSIGVIYRTYKIQ